MAGFLIAGPRAGPEAGSKKSPSAGLSNNRPPLTELGNGEQHPEVTLFKTDCP